MTLNKNIKGFVLLELLVGFMIFIFFLITFLLILMTLNKNLIQSHQKLEQTQVIKNQIEILKTKSFDQLVSDSGIGLTVKFLKPDLKEAVLITLNEQWIFRLSR